MIDIKYKNIYDEFVKRYEEIHVNPWHEISKEELNKIYERLVETLDVTNEYNFGYFMNFIIKRLSGLTDAHTKYSKMIPIPLNFRIFDKDILVNYPNAMRGAKLISINGIPTNQIMKELDDIITYGTDGKRRYELERALFNKALLFGLPSFRNSDELEYEFITVDGISIKRKFKKEEEYDDMFDSSEYEYGHPGKYRFIKNALVYTHSSVQNKFKEQIEESIQQLQSEDLSGIDTIIIDLRGNWGGNSLLNMSLMDFLKTQRDKKLICLTDYRVFSAGRYALRDLIKLGATTIGGEISTPINCFGNSNWICLDNHYFSISERYFHPFMNVSASSKKEFNERITESIRRPYIFHPDIKVEETKEDYLDGVDSVLSYALEYSNAMQANGKGNTPDQKITF